MSGGHIGPLLAKANPAQKSIITAGFELLIWETANVYGFIQSISTHQMIRQMMRPVGAKRSTLSTQSVKDRKGREFRVLPEERTPVFNCRADGCPVLNHVKGQA